MEYKENDRESAIRGTTCEADRQPVGGDDLFAQLELSTGGQLSTDSIQFRATPSPRPSSSSLLLSLNSLNLKNLKIQSKSCSQDFVDEKMQQAAATLRKLSREIGGQAHDARTFHQAWEDRLAQEGWHVRRFVPVELNGIMVGRLALLVTWPVVMAIELEKERVRKETALKLQGVQGLRVVILRGAQAKHGDGVDLILACNCPQKRKDESYATEEWVQMIKASNLFPNIDIEFVYRKCLLWCAKQGVPCLRGRVVEWCKREYPHTQQRVVKPRCRVCQMAFVAAEGQRCLQCKYRPR